MAPSEAGLVNLGEKEELDQAGYVFPRIFGLLSAYGADWTFCGFCSLTTVTVVEIYMFPPDHLKL